MGQSNLLVSTLPAFLTYYANTGQSFQPQFGAKQLRVVRNDDLIVGLHCSLSLCSGAFGAKAFFTGVDTIKHLIPNLEEESTMVGFVHQRLCMVAIMLEQDT
jgi:hypothetical protein